MERRAGEEMVVIAGRAIAEIARCGFIALWREMSQEVVSDVCALLDLGDAKFREIACNTISGVCDPVTHYVQAVWDSADDVWCSYHSVQV